MPKPKAAPKKPLVAKSSDRVRRILVVSEDERLHRMIYYQPPAWKLVGHFGTAYSAGPKDHTIAVVTLGKDQFCVDANQAEDEPRKKYDGIWRASAGYKRKIGLNSTAGTNESFPRKSRFWRMIEQKEVGNGICDQLARCVTSVYLDRGKAAGDAFFEKCTVKSALLAGFDNLAQKGANGKFKVTYY